MLIDQSNLRKASYICIKCIAKRMTKTMKYRQLLSVLLISLIAWGNVNADRRDQEVTLRLDSVLLYTWSSGEWVQLPGQLSSTEVTRSSTVRMSARAGPKLKAAGSPGSRWRRWF